MGLGSTYGDGWVTPPPFSQQLTLFLSWRNVTHTIKACVSWGFSMSHFTEQPLLTIQQLVRAEVLVNAAAWPAGACGLHIHHSAARQSGGPG